MSEAELLDRVRAYTDEEIIPAAPDLDARDEFPAQLVDGMRELGLFGLTIDPGFGGLGMGLDSYCRVIEEIARGWMSVAGILNTHLIVAWMIGRHGTAAQQARLLPRLADGSLRAAFSMSEPHCGSDLQAIRTVATPTADGWSVTGEKKWQANGLRAGVVAMLVKTDPEADPAHTGMSCLLIEKPPERYDFGGVRIHPLLRKLGYLGIDSTAMTLDAHRVSGDALLGGVPGRGFEQAMSGLEVGRINVAARAVGVARRALELAMAYADEREAFGRPISGHQAIRFKLAEMATKIEASRLLMPSTAQAKDRGERVDVEAGMAKLFASEACHEVVLDAMRIHGGNGYSKDYEIERLYRDAPMLLLGEGTSEIQKLVIARGLLGRRERSAAVA